MLDAYLYTGRRSPFGRHAGALARLRPDDMLASVIAQVVADTMPETADNLARDYQITREQADVFAAGSQSKYAAAKADGFYAEEIIAVEVPGGRAGPVTVAEDEHPRPQTDMAALAKLRPLFKDGVTTAGNASGINDGAVAMVVA